MADDFLAKQLPHNVTWGLTMLYSLEHPSNFGDSESQVPRGYPALYLTHASFGKMPRSPMASVHIQTFPSCFSSLSLSCSELLQHCKTLH